MMKIRYALLLSVSCLGLGSLAHAGLIPDITPVGKNTSIFTLWRGAPAGESLLLVIQGIEKALGLSHSPVNEQSSSRISYTHLAFQSKLLSASVIARRTSSDAAIQSYFYGSPRRINSPRDDNSDTAYDRKDYFFDLDVRVKPEHDIANFLSTHPNPIPTKRLFQSLSLFNNLKSHCLARRNSPPDCFCLRSYQEREYREQATASLPLIGKDRMSRKISQHKELEASRLLLPEQATADLPLTASVCFITDAGHCRENEFYTGANTPDGSSGGTPGGSSGGDGSEDNWEVDNEEKCKKEGYTNEDCGETATPGTPCLYDSSYHAGCVCKPEYNQTCTGADQAGKGASCDGKYKECCSLCSAYPYSDGTIPVGHVITETCQSCSGAKYKTKCNTNSSNTGTYISCGSATGSGSVCTDDSGTYYTKCTCPTNYEFNAQTQSCVCKTNFKYACTGTGYAGGTGTSCGNKYQTCNCASGYTWSASSGCVKCGSSFKYTCTGTNQTKPSSGCGGKYDKCNCKSGYKWSNGSCIAECSSSYKYTCTGTGYAGGAGSACGGKYTSCTCSSGYTWDGGNCQKALNGAQGDLYYCNGKVVGVKTGDMNFYVAMKNLYNVEWIFAYNVCQSYSFCSNLKGTMPSKDQLLTMYNNKSSLESLFIIHSGEEFATDDWYWSSTTSTKGYHYIVHMSNGDVYNNYNSLYTNHVRCVLNSW